MGAIEIVNGNDHTSIVANFVPAESAKQKKSRKEVESA